MDFYINKNSTLPILKLDLSDIQREYDVTDEMLNSSVATFSMFDIENEVYRIANDKAKVITENKLFNLEEPYIYFVVYKFSKENTSKSGLYIGEFKIDFIENDIGCGKLTVPLGETLQIVIRDSITKTTVLNQ